MVSCEQKETIAGAIADTLKFFETMFQPTDWITFRWIATWDQKAGQSLPKKNNVYPITKTCQQKDMGEIWESMWAGIGEGKWMNEYFGVAPRAAAGHDLECQIPMIRCLWMDIDYCTVSDAEARIVAANLPAPSILVSSGNGVHCYWLLSEAVKIEGFYAGKITRTKKCYFNEAGTEIYPDKLIAPMAFKLSAIMDGMGKLVGADHTIDIPRLLRIPGSMNRKTGEGKPVKLVRCDASMKYDIAIFEKYAEQSTKERQAVTVTATGEIAEQYTRTFEQLTKNQAATWAARIKQCEEAEEGKRSEAVRALCLWGNRFRLSADAVYEAVADIGKFAERSEGWFNREYRRAAVVIAKEEAEKAAKENADMLEMLEVVSFPAYLPPLVSDDVAPGFNISPSNDIAPEIDINKSPSDVAPMVDIISTTISTEQKKTPHNASQNASKSKKGDKTGGKEGPSVAERLITIGETMADLWVSSGVAWASVRRAGHSENVPIESKEFSQWLWGTLYDTKGIVANDKAMSAAISILSHKAMTGGKEFKTWLRWGWAENRIYCDLGNEKWDVVEVTPEGWQVIQNCPIKFRRTSRTAPMPYPVRGGDMNALYPLLHCTEDSWILFQSFLLDCIKPGSRPYFVCCITGEQGAAKSSAVRLIRKIIDPVPTGDLSALGTEEDIGVQAQSEFILAYDNVSHLKKDMSDCLCRISTGAGFKTRKMYTNDILTVLPLLNPVIMNGIPDFATAPDLLSRCILISQPIILEEERKDEGTLEAEFNRAWPTIFGALLSHASDGLKRWPTITLPRLPRMADGHKWVAACTGDTKFLDLHNVNETEAIRSGLESNPLALLLREIVKIGSGKFRGTATDLFDSMRQAAAIHAPYGKVPEGAASLSSAVRRDAPALRKGWGWEVEFPKSNGNKSILLVAPA